MRETTRLHASKGYPLGALFLLIALVAVVAAQLSWLATGKFSAPELATAASLGGLSGMVFGLMIGLYHFRRSRGAILGIGAGCVFGAFSGPVCTAATQFPSTSLYSALAGGIGLVACAAIYRAVNGNDPTSNYRAYEKLLKEGNATGAFNLRTQERIPDSLVPAVLVTCFCCLPFGIPAIVYAVKANGAVSRGKMDEAHYASKQARMWIRVSLGCGIMILVGFLILAVSEFFMPQSTQ